MKILLLFGFVTSAFANEICKESLKGYPGHTKSDIEQRQKVITACAGSHGADDTLLKRLLNRCETHRALKSQSDSIQKCKIDAYQYLSWTEYP